MRRMAVVWLVLVVAASASVVSGVQAQSPTPATLASPSAGDAVPSATPGSSPEPCTEPAPTTAPDVGPTPSPSATGSGQPTTTSAQDSPAPGAPGSPLPTSAPAASCPPISGIPGLDAITGTDGRFTVLLLGSDARGNLGGERTDVIMVATINPATGNVAFLSLPRDMRNVPYGPGQTYPVQVTGLFQAFEQSGMTRTQALERMKKAMSYAFGIEIDYVAITHFTGVVNLINDIGGVNVTLAAPFVDPTAHLHNNKGIHMHAGVNHLDGGEALAFARSRHTTTDYDRSRRQHELITAVIGKVRQMGSDAIAPLAKFAFQEIQTDVPASALPQMIGLALAANLDHVKSVVLGPRTFATGGSVLYSIYIKLKAVRDTFQKIFSH